MGDDGEPPAGARISRGPQGPEILVLINDLGFEGQINNTGEIITSRKNLKKVNEIHLKYVDDLTMAESINLGSQLVPTRSGLTLPLNNSRLKKQLLKTENYAKDNDMKLNHQKSKVMFFNPCTSVDFTPDLRLEKNPLEVVEKLKILGVIIQSDLKWKLNTEYIVRKANSRLWVLRRLKNLGASINDLIDVYQKQVRSVMELAVPAAELYRVVSSIRALQ